MSDIRPGALYIIFLNNDGGNDGEEEDYMSVYV